MARPIARQLFFVALCLAAVVHTTAGEASEAEPDATQRLLEGLPEELAGKAKGLLKDAMAQSVGPEGIWENLQAFYHAVDWSENWIRALLASHALIALLVVLTRSNFNAQVALFLYICVVVFSAERLNSVARTHWRSFSKQMYFDKHGIFASGVLSAPLLLIGFGQLVMTLRRSAYLLVDVKKHEFKQSAMNKQKAKGAKSTKAE